MSRIVYIILGLVLAGVIVAAFIGASQRKQEAANVQAGERSNNVIGKKGSPVTFTEFVDFQCEACYAYYPIMKQVEEKYKDRVRFEVRYLVRKNNSGHPASWAAAQAAESAARQGKFWEMQDKLFTNQKIWEQAPDPQAVFRGYAEELGLDMARYDKDRVSSDVEGTLQKDSDDIRALGGDGTPSFTLNGKYLGGNDRPQTNVESFSKLLDDALAKAGQ